MNDQSDDNAMDFPPVAECTKDMRKEFDVHQKKAKKIISESRQNAKEKRRQRQKSSENNSTVMTSSASCATRRIKYDEDGVAEQSERNENDVCTVRNKKRNSGAGKFAFPCGKSFMFEQKNNDEYDEFNNDNYVEENEALHLYDNNNYNDIETCEPRKKRSKRERKYQLEMETQLDDDENEDDPDEEEEDKEEEEDDEQRFLEFRMNKQNAAFMRHAKSISGRLMQQKLISRRQTDEQDLMMTTENSTDAEEDGRENVQADEFDQKSDEGYTGSEDSNASKRAIIMLPKHFAGGTAAVKQHHRHGNSSRRTRLTGSACNDLVAQRLKRVPLDQLRRRKLVKLGRWGK